MDEKTKEEQPRLLTINSYVWVINRPQGTVPHVLMTSVRQVLRYIGGKQMFILEGFPDKLFSAEELYDYREYQIALDDLNSLLEENAQKESDDPPEVRLWINQTDVEKIRCSATRIKNPTVKFSSNSTEMLESALNYVIYEADQILNLLGK